MNLPNHITKRIGGQLLLFDLFTNPFLFVSYLVSLILALTVHEYFHALTAVRLGDKTPEYSGRLSLNPLAHLDPVGTIFLLLAGFGWGKPVPINSNNFRNPKIDEMKVALAGPLSNLGLAIIFALPLRFLNLPLNTMILLETIVSINLVLMVFNLLPIPPLDGSHFLKIFISEVAYRFVQQFGIFLLLLFLFTPIASTIIQSVVGFFYSLIVGGHSFLV